MITAKKLNAYSLTTRLVASAILSGLIYLFIFTLPFPLANLYGTIPPVDYTKLTGYSQNGLWVYILGIGTLFGLYIWAIRLTALTKSVFAGSIVFLSSAAFSVILIFSYPLTAIDLFIYAIRTRGWALYGLPPLSTPPEALPTSDPWLGLAGEWVDAASPYGPLWEWLSLGAFYLSNGSFLGHLFALKILGMLAYLGCAWLVYQTLQHLHPNWAIAGTIAFAWNPLVLFESVQNAHNDIVMTFFLLAAVRVFVHMKPLSFWPILVCVLLALSILVKFVTVIVGPFLLLALARQQATWPRRIGSLGLYGFITAALVIGPMLLVWPGWENWAILQAGSGAGRSLLALFVLGFRDSLGTNTAFDLSRNIILAIFGLIYLYHLWRTLSSLRQASSTSLSLGLAQGKSSKLSRTSTPISTGMPSHSPAPITVARPPIAAVFFTLFWYVLLAAPVFHAWYLLWFLPLALFLIPQQRPLIATIIFSMTALLIIPYFETIRVWYPALLRNHFLGHLIGVPLLILPPASSLFLTISLVSNSEVSSNER